ncbi:hypothetical protein HFN89_02900 [Rhizobium laguerreae]|nr:hypothetical protein [Rhizobium laguerreae]
MAAPTLKLELARTGGGRSWPLGRWDLFLPAVNALADGSLWQWPTAVPASYELCRRVDHGCREAAWDAALAVAGPKGWIERFTGAMAAADLEVVANDYAVLEAAISVRDLATGLVEAIRTAAVADPGGPAVHPLADSETPDVNMPFGFAVSVARWKGVSPKAFVDFAVGSGSPDAEAFLETVIRQPSKWFNDISALEAALLRLASDRDVEAFRIAVADWNARQDVSIRMPNRDVLVPALWARSEDAVHWGEEFLVSARQLVRSLLAERWSWWPDDFAAMR